MRELDEIYSAFIAALRGMTLDGLEEHTHRAYRDAQQGPVPALFLGFHLGFMRPGTGARFAR